MDPENILIATQCTPVDPWKSETLRLFESINHFGGNLKNAKKIACFTDPIDSVFQNKLIKLGVNSNNIKILDEKYTYANKINLLTLDEEYDLLIAFDTD